MKADQVDWSWSENDFIYNYLAYNTNKVGQQYQMQDLAKEHFGVDNVTEAWKQMQQPKESWVDLEEWSPMERYPLWTLLAGHNPTNTIWSNTMSSVVQTAPQEEWSLVGWEPLNYFLDGKVNCTLTYIETQDLDSQGHMASAPVGMRVDENGNGIFWKTNNGQLQLIERHAGVRTILYEQPAPIIGSDIGFIVVGDTVKLTVGNFEVFSGTTTHLDAGYGAIFFGHISQNNVTLVDSLRVAAEGYYAPMETHPDYEVLPGGSEHSRFEYNSITGELWQQGATTLDTAVVNMTAGIVSTCNFRGYAQWSPLQAHYVTACWHIQDAENYCGIRLHNNRLQVFEVLNGVFDVLYNEPYISGAYVEALVNGKDVTLIADSVVTTLTMPTLDSGYVGCVNRAYPASRYRPWSGWTWTFDPQYIYDPIETSPLWDSSNASDESMFKSVGTILYYRDPLPAPVDAMLTRSDVPAFENGRVGVTWRSKLIPEPESQVFQLAMRINGTRNFVGVRVGWDDGGTDTTDLFQRVNNTWTKLGSIPIEPEDGDKLELECAGDTATVRLIRDGVTIGEDSATISASLVAGNVGVFSRSGAAPEAAGTPVWSNMYWYDVDTGNGGQD